MGINMFQKFKTHYSSIIHKLKISSFLLIVVLQFFNVIIFELDALAKPVIKNNNSYQKQGLIYPQVSYNGKYIHWIPEQMPLKVYVSKGVTLDSIIDEELGAPFDNIDNINKWPDLVAYVINNPSKLNALPCAEGYITEHYQAVLDGINSWHTFEKEGLFNYVFTNDPTDADIYVFFVNHFVDKLGMGLFANDIRGYTAKRSFDYNQVMQGKHADFKPILILLRTTDSNGQPMPLSKMKAAAAHEFGHALGIEGHSTNPVDLMSIYYGNGNVSQNDAATLRFLYTRAPDLIP